MRLTLDMGICCTSSRKQLFIRSSSQESILHCKRKDCAYLETGLCDETSRLAIENTVRRRNGAPKNIKIVPANQQVDVACEIDERPVNRNVAVNFEPQLSPTKRKNLKSTHSQAEQSVDHPPLSPIFSTVANNSTVLILSNEFTGHAT